MSTSHKELKMVQNLISFPPNTKEASAIKGKFTIVVDCPHCGGKHHHIRIAAYYPFIKSVCGIGYYTVSFKAVKNG